MLQELMKFYHVIWMMIRGPRFQNLIFQSMIWIYLVLRTIKFDLHDLRWLFHENKWLNLYKYIYWNFRIFRTIFSVEVLWFSNEKNQNCHWWISWYCILTKVSLIYSFIFLSSQSFSLIWFAHLCRLREYEIQNASMSYLFLLLSQWILRKGIEFQNKLFTELNKSYIGNYIRNAIMSSYPCSGDENRFRSFLVIIFDMIKFFRIDQDLNIRSHECIHLELHPTSFYYRQFFNFLMIFNRRFIFLTY